MPKEINLFKKHVNVKTSGADPKRLKTHVVKKEDQDSALAKRVNAVSKHQDLSFGQIQDKILSFLHKNHSFDAGMMQHWVEQRALKLERKERRFRHKVTSLFGRGKKFHESSGRLKLLAEQIEGERQGIDPMIIKRFRHLPDEIVRADREQLIQIYRWVASHKERYGKEIMDLIAFMQQIPHSKINWFGDQLKKLINEKEAKMLDALFAGKTIQVEVLAGAGS